MGSWFNVKIKYTQVTEDDKVKTINESYLFDALSYTEAEARAYEFMASNLADFEMVDITKMKLNEVFFLEDGGEIWFKCRVQFITFDEKTKSEKKTAAPMLINAIDVKAAYESLQKKLGNLEDYIISDINVTKIVEVIPYDKLIDQKIADGRLKPLSEVEKVIKVGMEESVPTPTEPTVDIIIEEENEGESNDDEDLENE